MPGKVNPVLPEATLMVCFQVIGNDAAVTAAGACGLFELNVAMPVMARNVLESVRLLATSSTLLAQRCVDGITADAERMRRYAASSPSVVTPLNRHLGYEAAAAIAKKALADGATIRETVIALGYVERYLDGSTFSVEPSVTVAPSAAALVVRLAVTVALPAPVDVVRASAFSRSALPVTLRSAPVELLSVTSPPVLSK